MTFAKTKIAIALLAAGLAAISPNAADPVKTVSGIVTDEGGNPLENVRWIISGRKELRNGAWIRVIRTGFPREHFTESNGRFAIPFYESNVKYDLQFDKPGYAPCFLYDISSDAGEINVVMRRGLVTRGKVVRVVNGQRRPVLGTMVQLRLPSEDLWYQKRAFTDMNGKYTFRVCQPPKPRKWQVVFAGEVVQLDIEQGKPAEGVDFEIKVRAVKHSTAK